MQKKPPQNKKEGWRDGIGRHHTHDKVEYSPEEQWVPAQISDS